MAATAEPKTRLPTLGGMPEPEAMHELMKSYDKVSARILRRNDKGQHATVFGNVSIKLDELLNIEDWLKVQAGGGGYLVILRDPNDLTNTLMKFNLPVEGPPLPPAQHTGNPVAAGGFGNVPSINTPMSRWAQGLNPQNQAAYTGGPSIASDALAVKELTETKARAARLEAELVAERREMAQTMRRLEEQNEKQRLQAMEDRHKSELQLVQEQMKRQNDEMKMLLTSSKDSSSSADQIKAYAAMAGAIAPVFATMISSNKDSQAKAMEVQTSGMNNVMAAMMEQSKKPDPMMDMFKTLGPIVIPMMTEQMKAKGPEGQAMLYSAMSENQLNSVAMMAQLIEAFAGNQQEEPMWLPMVREVLQGAVNVGQAMMDTPGAPGAPGAPPQGMPMVAGAPPHHELPPQPIPTGAEVVYDTEATVAAAVDATAPAGEEPSSGANPSEQRLRAMFSLLPKAFKTTEWEVILLEMHNEETPPEELAELIASHIAHCLNFDLLPEEMETVQTDPAGTFARLLSILPIAKSNPARAEALVGATVEQLRLVGALIDPEPMAEPVEEPAAGIIEVESVEKTNSVDSAPVSA